MVRSLYQCGVIAYSFWVWRLKTKRVIKVSVWVFCPLEETDNTDITFYLVLSDTV